jgi:hypothetical protein
MQKRFRIIVFSLSVVILLYLVSKLLDGLRQIDNFEDMTLPTQTSQSLPSNILTPGMINNGKANSTVTSIDSEVLLPYENGNTGTNLAKEFGDSTSKIISTLTGEQDPRFQMDPVKRDEILREIKSELEFDPYKTDVDRAVISEIYGKYFDTNVFKKFVEIDKESKQYIKSGNYQYIPESKKSDYDLQKYQELRTSTSYGINPISDEGINVLDKLSRLL